MNNNLVIVINGVGGSGKDTFVELCQEMHPKVMNFSSVSFVKTVARYCGWEGTKSDKDRKLLSDLKDVLSEWDDLPFKSVDKFISCCKNKIIFIHSREFKDVERIHREFNAIRVLIQNDRVPTIETNHADREVTECFYDYIIYNNGTIENLKNSAEIFLKDIEKKGLNYGKK